MGLVGLAGLAVACDTGPQQTAATPEVVPNAVAAVEQEQATTPLPMADVRLSGFLEIDDLDGTGSGNNDANLCVQGSAGEAGACDLERPAADNPNFPGPDSANPDVLGTDELAYTDWAHLDRTRAFFHYDLDVQDPAQPDDILKQGSCVDTGPSPSKANIELLGVAANDDYLYLMMDRSKTQGQEEFHFFFTQREAHLGPVDGCANPTWIWDLEDGDIQVTVRFQSTSGLPSGEVFVQVYNDPDNDPSNDKGMLAEDLVRSNKWGAFAGPAPAYAAFNVAPGKRTMPGEDEEFDLDGEALASGQTAEVAVDIATVFGQGCGLARVMSVITTASGSGGDKDDLKDFYAPVVVKTGTPELAMELDQECTEELSYQVAITSWGDDAPTLGDENLQLDFSYDCNGHNGNFNDDLGEGVLAIPIEHPVVCTVTAVMTGSGPYEHCVADVTEDFTLYPDLGAEAALAQAECGGPWTWGGSGHGGQQPYAYEWHFSGVGFQVDTDTTLPTGSGSLLPGTVPADILGTITVTDARGCEAIAEDDIPAYHALALEVTPVTEDDECYDGDIAFDAAITGGSGEYALSWTETGTADLLEPCETTTALSESDGDASLSCAFDLGPGVCATGGVALTVTDAVCGSQGPLGVDASLVSSVDVSATP
jgi:hypothetical protein